MSLEPSPIRLVTHSVAGRPRLMKMGPSEAIARKICSLLNKLTIDNFEEMSDKVIAWINKCEGDSTKCGATLTHATDLVLQHVKSDERRAAIYARLCRKVMEHISPDVQDGGTYNSEGKPITGGLLFRTDFYRICSTEVLTTAGKANANDGTVKGRTSGFCKSILSPDDYFHATRKSKRQYLGLVRFIGELFKLQMLEKRIMHECINFLLSKSDIPEDKNIESLCQLLITVGRKWDTPTVRDHMDVYLNRMKGLANSNNVSPRIQAMLLNVIELQERKWIPRPQDVAINRYDKITRKEKAHLIGPDGWSFAFGPLRPANKVGDLAGFRKIAKSGGPMTFGHSSVFSMLGRETSAEASAQPRSFRSSRPARRNASIDLEHGASIEPTRNPKLNLVPRSKALAEMEEE
ncbi:armadillo-type protein [Phellopilus nigrolimitatus]|nr:armadillo-type protein [Phellopilus nigrolimitatus]